MLNAGCICRRDKITSRRDKPANLSSACLCADAAKILHSYQSSNFKRLKARGRQDVKLLDPGVYCRAEVLIRTLIRCAARLQMFKVDREPYDSSFLNGTKLRAYETAISIAAVQHLHTQTILSHSLNSIFAGSEFGCSMSYTRNSLKLQVTIHRGRLE